MSATLTEQPLSAMTPPASTNIPSLLHVRVEDAEIDESLPQSNFPCLDSRPGVKGAWQATEVPFRDITQLRNFCKDSEVSPLRVFQAAWALVLRCYLGRTSVCFACDSLEIAKGADVHFGSGTFNTCRVELGDTISVMEILKGSCMKKFSFLSQQSKSSLYDQLGGPDTLPINTSLVYREVGLQEWSEMGRLAVQNHAGADWNNCDIVAYVGLSENIILVSIYYLESILSVVSASSVASVYGKAINEILTDPDRLVGGVNLFTQRDLGLIQNWNSSFPQKVNACVHDLVLQHAEKSPQSPAICSWDGELTYRQLDTLSFRLARHLVSAGIEHGTLVPICFRKSMYAVVAMVAILRAGGAFVPLDPSHPQDRLRGIIQKANANIVVGSPDTAHLFHGTVDNVVEVSCTMIESLGTSLEHPIPQVSENNAAFVLFTSGSTGKPKGIVQEHASVSTSSLAHGSFLRVTSSSRVFQYAAYTFDVSMMDIFTTLIWGGCVCIPSEEDRMGSFTSVMNEMQVNWVLFTPSVASLISPEEVPSLQTLVFGGEAVKQENISRWFGRVRLFNCYGPAECGACAMSEVSSEDSRPGNIGRQFGAEFCWVVDPENHNRLQPIGAVGEMVVEGPTLARGYLNDVKKTQAVFIKSPTWPRGAGPEGPRRLYKTGDLVRQNSDGTFDFTGRKDHQLKVRGQRVELGEVEYHLSTFPGIALSMAVMPASGSYAGTLVGVIQLHQLDRTQTRSTKIDFTPSEHVLPVNFDKGKLAAFLKSKLPSYMIPNHLLIVSCLPLSASGKIDRKVVDAWLVTSARTITTEVTSNGHKEDLLSQDDATALELCSKILSMVAQNGSILFSSLSGSNLSLAAVGLNSIQVISLSMFIRQRFGVKVCLDILVDPKSTVRSVAATIDELVAGDHDTTVEPAINILETYHRYRQHALSGFFWTESGLQNIFVTGATGFLGSRILYQLCGRTDVRKIVVHVRSQNAELALERIVKSAKLAGWWTDKYLWKLEAWAGDLAKPMLGLKSGQWRRLCGYGPPKECITGVIHNGATVNWNASLPSLKATNFDSTVDLLQAASQSAVLSHFVFVSGGQQLRVGEDDDTNIAEEVTRSNGYAQTKFLSELMVKEYARGIAPSQQRVSILKPGYIIGTIGDGIVKIDDFIWRLTASCVDIKGYNADDAKSWLFVSDVDTVAAAVLDCCSKTEATQPRSANVVKILDGILLSDFWSILRHELGYEMYPLSSKSWMNRIYNAVETKGEKHELFPLLQIIEDGQGKWGSPCDPRGTVDVDEGRVKAAVKKSVEYLSSIGFLPSRQNERPAQ